MSVFLTIFWILFFLFLIKKLIEIVSEKSLFDEYFNSKFSSTEKKLKFLREVGLLLFLVFVISIFINILNKEYDNVIKILTPLGVLISAFLASYSMIANIENTNKNEKNKLYRDKLELISLHFKELYSELSKENIQNQSIKVGQLSHLNLLISIYNPALYNQYKEFEENISKLHILLHEDENGKVTIKLNQKLTSEESYRYNRNAEFQSLVLKNKCETFQKIIQDEIRQYINS